MSNLYAVIMAGGAGTRFWPASRSLRPKQLLPLAGAGDEPLLTATVRRLRPLVPEERCVIVTGEHLTDATRRAVPGVPTENVLAEPAARNTAPCIAWATAVIARRDPDAVVMVLPSDHFIGDEAGLTNVLRAAVRVAEQGAITTVGIVPTRAETGYGYIELGAPLEGGSGAYAVKRFVEKPDRARAESFLEAGPSRYLWNAGMFFFRARRMLAAIEAHLPSVARGVERIVAAAPSEESGALREIFPTLESVSIDHGVMEKLEDLAVVPGAFGWNDVGSWQSAWELAPRDERGNALGPEDLAIDAADNLVRSLGATKKTVALVGVSGLVVVETDDAILVIPRERAQDVRLVVDALKKSGRTTLL